MNTDQFERWLKNQGVLVDTKKGTGHKDLLNPANGKRSILPTHGGRKQLGTGLVERIKKDLGLK
ncbi:hypothetical protein [Pararhodospirillum photometricum]|uniref:hypothetical protein n=1 Tax=Pararhodospirillum photometricum TaxID=1084 RepID=UPI0005A168A4|nr:hypothetical protein [Pararhodospirillum photometricum]